MKPQITEHQARILMNQAYRLLMTVYDVIEVGELYNHPRYPNLHTKLSERHTRRYELLQKILSAVLASTSPEPVVVNAVVEIAQGTTNLKSCYQCDTQVPYLFSDSRCKDCTRLTSEDVYGGSDSYQSIIESIPLSAYCDLDLQFPTHFWYRVGD